MFFNGNLQSSDKEVFNIINGELNRQKENLQLIASENFASKAVMEAQGSVFTNKYSEGYPGKKYYSGCKFADEIENLAISRACELFKCKYANVQPHSGSQTNQAVFLALVKPGDSVMGLSMNSGGHLTHGAAPNLSGKWFNAIPYDVDKNTLLIDMGEVEALAKQHKPKLIIAGASAYSRHIDFKRFREIADSVGAYLLADIAHYAGLIAGESYPSPIEHAHVTTTTTHKVLRGARGGIILSNSEEIMKKINSALFPGLQGGPLVHAIAGKAVAFREALMPEYKVYAHNVIKHAKTLAESLMNEGISVITNGTDSHIVLVDLRDKNLKGNAMANLLESSGIICNKNGIPFDAESPFVTSGLRFGTAAETTRGLQDSDFKYIGKLIGDLINEKTSPSEAKEKVKAICLKFPIYS